LPSGRGEERVFCTVLQGKANVAEALVSAGLAEVQRHRVDEDRSVHYDLLLDAETKCAYARPPYHHTLPPSLASAHQLGVMSHSICCVRSKDAKRGIHSGKPPAAFSVVDLALRPRANPYASAAEKEAAAQQVRAAAPHLDWLSRFILP
jgi:hypothetical protein